MTSHCSKVLARALVLLVVAAPALARLPGRCGLRAGLNLSAFAGEFGDLVGPDLRAAPNAAFVYEYDFAPRVAFHTEVGYSGKGGKAKSEITDQAGNPAGTATETWSFEYVEVPLLVRGRLPALGSVTPFLELGPSLGIRLSGRFETRPSIVGDHRFTDDMKLLDLGFGAGLGVEFAAGPGRLGVEARYTRGFSDLFDVSSNLSTINQAWTFALAFTR